ncbi:unnamed protein product [Mytilus edulis]|uniref:B box-type domain-containing protein n=1 Tax=Mytilus edulis TaxID=6550 RepID=A0A8S3QK12_MYTED|nr:unnamed protein product [Mytilus edulis]
MTSSDMVVCTLCYDEGVSKDASAVTWCTECEGFLCIDCERHHQKSKMSKDHKTISSEVYKKLPKCMQETKSQCRDHKNKFELYCSFHACPCCVQCVTDKHLKCQDIKPLSDILREIKSSASVQLLEKDLTDVKGNFEETISYLKNRMNTSNIQKTKAAEKIRFIKTSIDDFLTKIEQEMLADLETKHSKLDLKMNRLLQQLEHQANQIDKWLSGFSEMTRFATELQMYVGLLEIEKVTSEADKYIEDLRNGKHLDENNLEVTITSSLQSILKDVKALGKVDINSSQSSLRIKAGRKDQAQDLVRLVPRIEEIKPTILRTLIIPKGMDIANVFACIILPDGRFIILDNHDVDGQLLLFSNDGMFIRQVSTFPGESYDACFVKNNTVAVLFGSSNKITLVDIEMNEITKKLNFQVSVVQ